MSTITSENLVEVSGAKVEQRAILKDGKTILVGIGGNSGSNQVRYPESIQKERAGCRRSGFF